MKKYKDTTTEIIVEDEMPKTSNTMTVDGFFFRGVNKT